MRDVQQMHMSYNMMYMSSVVVADVLCADCFGDVHRFSILSNVRGECTSGQWRDERERTTAYVVAGGYLP